MTNVAHFSARFVWVIRAFFSAARVRTRHGIAPAASIGALKQCALSSSTSVSFAPAASPNFEAGDRFGPLETTLGPSPSGAKLILAVDLGVDGEHVARIGSIPSGRRVFLVPGQLFAPNRSARNCSAGRAFSSCTFKRCRCPA